MSYSAINSARSALSTFLFLDSKPIGQHPLVIRLLKGVYNKKPALPKHNNIWDPQTVLEVLQKMTPVASLDLYHLTLKVITLLWLLTGQRGQSMHLIDVRNITLTDHSVQIAYGNPLKTSRPGHHQKPIHIKAYAPNRALCIVTALRRYLKVTKLLRKGNQLFIITQKPYTGASRDTISRWVKVVMAKAGLDLTKYTPHSLRAASTSAAVRAKVPIDTILQTAGWTRESTFRKYYNKPVHSKSVAEGVLEGVK